MKRMPTFSIPAALLTAVAMALTTGSAASQVYCPFGATAGTGPVSPPVLFGEVEAISAGLAQDGSGSVFHTAETQAYAESRPSYLRGYCYATYPLASTVEGSARCRWSYPDLRFSSATTQTVLVNLQLLSSGTSAGSFYSDFRVDVDLWDDLQSPPVHLSHTEYTGLHPNNTIPPVAWNVTTNRDYRLEVAMTVSAFGNQGWAEIDSRVTFAPQPFVVPAGVTADSAWAQISNNSFNVPAPLEAPHLGVAAAFVVNQTASVAFSQAAPGVIPSVMVVGFGLPPVCNTMFGPNLGIGVLNPLVTITIPLDPSGLTGAVSIPIPGGLTGLPILFQAVQLTGISSLADLYSSNLVSVVVQ